MKFLVATSGSVPAKEKADYIVNIAKHFKADIAALHIIEGEDKGEGNAALEIFVKSAKRAGVRLTKILQTGDIAQTIIETAVRVAADMIIIGASQGKDGGEWISSDIIKRSKIPIVVVPHAFVLMHPIP